MISPRPHPLTRRPSGAVALVGGTLALVAFGACNGGPAASPGGEAGARGGDGAQGGGAGGAAGDVAGPTCTTLPVLEPLLTGLPPSAHGLRVANGSLFFVDTSAGSPAASGATGGLRRLGVDGTGDGILYAALPGQQLLDVIAGTDTLYLLQQEMVGSSSRVFLYWMPQAGGTPARVSPTSAGWAPNLVHFVGIDAGSVYLVDQDDASGKARLTRVDLADGAETALALSTTIRSAQLSGSALWFYDGGTTYTVPAQATGPAATQVGALSCAPRTMSVTSKAIFCGGGLGITRLDLQATKAVNAVDLSASDPGQVQPHPAPTARPSTWRRCRARTRGWCWRPSRSAGSAVWMTTVRSRW